MSLTRLGLVGFRNLRDTSLELPKEGVAVVGRNAQGKSSLLEAVHYLETFRSFRGGRDEQLVRIGDGHFRITAELDTGRSAPRTVTAAFELASRKKKVTVDGQGTSRLGDAIGFVGTVLFTPEDIRLIADGPGERRRYMDVLLSLNEDGYLASLQGFRHALAQRNAALRAGASASLVEVWDTPLIRAGSEVALARAAWIREHADGFEEWHLEISGSARARMDYGSSIPDIARSHSVDEVAQAFRSALDRSRTTESSRRTTLVGPHRDDILLFGAGLDGQRRLRDYASGGERRTAALALRLLEWDTLRQRRDLEPILLLDDLFAELDEHRSTRVMELLDRLASGQVIMTAPKESDLRFRSDRLARWSIEAGEIRT